MIFIPISFAEKFALLAGQWQSTVVGETNDYQFKTVQIGGDSTWHSNVDTDAAFIVLEGASINPKDCEVTLGPGETYGMPQVKEHKPYACGKVKVVNTGDGPAGQRTAQNDVSL